MNKKIYIAGLLLLSSVLATQAQEKVKFELSYNVSIPTGEFKTNEVQNTSYRGGIGELSYSLSDRFSLGLQSGYQNYNQRYSRQLYQTPDHQTISAVKTNAIDVIPIVLRGTYFPLGADKSKAVQPYLSAGAGLNFVNYLQYLGEFGGSETAAPLAIQAGAGVIIPVGKMLPKTGIKIGATYNYSGYSKNSIDIKLNNIGVHAGLVLPLR